MGIGLGVGLAAGLACSLLAAFPPGTARGLQLTLADLLFVQSGGPELGYRHARSDIVLVTQDEKTGASWTSPTRPWRRIFASTPCCSRTVRARSATAGS